MRKKWSGSSPGSEFFQRPVVCNTSPVISLCKAGLGRRLVALFPKVVTSTAVAAELQAKDVGDSAEIEKVLSTIEILPSPPLDPGEASILQLAKEHGISGVLMDEPRGRRVATDVFGFEVAGTCALLLRAKRLTLIPEVRSPLDRIIVNGLFISLRLRNDCLRLAGE
jgi:predicted nucleic acid-binding protein